SPKAVRAYTNALRLQQNGIGTPTPVAYLLVQHGGLLQESYLVTLQSHLTRNFYEFRHHPLAGHEPVVEAFAQFTADLHRKSILHKDYSPGNILFDVMENGQVAFELVDINRMLFDQTVNMDKACYNFRKLWGGEDFFVLLASAYARSRGWNEEECCRRTIHYWQQFWRHRT
ncbi:MAG: tyrosine protein kinase, partial [Paludibacteraceae bacterium]|nr:tyrosine protein kinase [Paludibacteraceae bacterium]